MYSKVFSLLSVGFVATLNAETETTYVTVASEASGVHTNDIMRFLDISYSTQATDLYNDPEYTFIGYRFSWGSGDYVLFSFDDSDDDLQLLGDNVGINQYTEITFLDSTVGGYGSGDSGYWCKACGTSSTSRYGDTCWGITSTSDTNRGCGCNSGGWTGTGIYYGGWEGVAGGDGVNECNVCWCFGGAFAGYKTNGQQKGNLDSVGVTIEMVFESEINVYNEYDNGYFIGVRYTGSLQNSITWQEAENYCQDNHGTNLASIHSETENTQAFEAAIGAGATPDGANNLIWFGFHDIDSEGTFVWTDGSNVDYANWDSGEPNDFSNGNPGEDCTSVRSSGRWNDLPCDPTVLAHTVTSFVCNKKRFTCEEQCSELTEYGEGCADDECLKDCANCVTGVAWNDYAGGQDVTCQCHDNGCDQCKSGYFKIDYDFPCQSCSESFEGCLHCTDFYGCQQCAEGYELVEDNQCGEDSVHNTGNVKIHYCTEAPTSSPTPRPTNPRVIAPQCPNYNDYDYGSCTYDSNCNNCQSWGCAICNDDYYKMGNFQRCQSCQTNYPNCKQCNDWNGCTQCDDGYTLTWVSDCNDEVCV